jgi:phosphoribosylamine--glycine ligase
MKILLYGSGGREHALALALSQSPSCDKFYATPGNPGIFTCAEKADVNPNDYSSIVNFCKSHNIDLVFIGPEQPLAEGLTDLLTQNGINVFGPSKYASQLEASKGWAKEFMKKYNIPTASFKCFD